MAKFLYWTPRILTIISLVFMTMFSFDAFGGDVSFGMKILGFLEHNIPVIILAAFLIIAWKWELAGGVLFILGSVSGTIFFNSFSGNPASLIVIAPFLVSGILFIISGITFRKNSVSRN